MWKVKIFDTQYTESFAFLIYSQSICLFFSFYVSLFSSTVSNGKHFWSGKNQYTRRRWLLCVSWSYPASMDPLSVDVAATILLSGSSCWSQIRLHSPPFCYTQWWLMKGKFKRTILIHLRVVFYSMCLRVCVCVYAVYSYDFTVVWL